MRVMEQSFLPSAEEVAARVRTLAEGVEIGERWAMKHLQSDSEFITVRSAAQILGVHENTVRNWMSEGRLAHYELPGSGFRRVSVRSVEAILNERVPGESMSRDVEMLDRQDDLLVALTSKPPLFGDRERATLRTLPPWRAVMIARLAVPCGVMEQAELDALVEEARAVGGQGTLAQHAQA